jgi:hypothetical protein
MFSFFHDSFCYNSLQLHVARRFQRNENLRKREMPAHRSVSGTFIMKGRLGLCRTSPRAPSRAGSFQFMGKSYMGSLSIEFVAIYRRASPSLEPALTLVNGRRTIGRPFKRYKCDICSPRRARGARVGKVFGKI